MLCYLLRSPAKERATVGLCPRPQSYDIMIPYALKTRIQKNPLADPRGGICCRFVAAP